jgi:hypothetical protein
MDLAGFTFESREAVEAHPDPYCREVAHRVFDETCFFVDVRSPINRYLVTPPQALQSESETLPDGTRHSRTRIETPKGDLTAETQYDPRTQTSWTVAYPVKTREDIERIVSVSWELPAGLSPDDGAVLPADFARRGILAARVSSPFVCVAGMMRYELFLELTLTDPDLMARLTEMCRQRVLAVLEVILSRPGIDLVWMGGSEWVTPPVTSTSTYDALVQEQERSIIDYVHANSDAPVHIHCHGHVRHALQRTIERGGDYTEPVEPPPDGDITMAEAKALADGRITLGGNLECRVLCNEDEAAAEAAVRAAFEGGKERFVLRPTERQSPRMGEQEFRNYMRVVDVWEEIGNV